MSEYNELFAALAKAQGEMEVAGKKSANPAYKSKYADLESIIEASRPALARNGLSIMHTFEFMDGKQILVTTLGHTSGQHIRSAVVFNPPDAATAGHKAMHIFGSYVTYLKRYAYQALVGVASCDDDDDGNKVVAYEKETEEAALKARALKAPMSAEQLDIVNDRLNQLPAHVADSWLEQLLSNEQVRALSSVPAIRFNALLRSLDKLVKGEHNG